MKIGQHLASGEDIDKSLASCMIDLRRSS